MKSKKYTNKKYTKKIKKFKGGLPFIAAQMARKAAMSMGKQALKKGMSDLKSKAKGGIKSLKGIQGQMSGKGGIQGQLSGVLGKGGIQGKFAGFSGKGGIQGQLAGLSDKGGIQGLAGKVGIQGQLEGLGGKLGIQGQLSGLAGKVGLTQSPEVASKPNSSTPNSSTPNSSNSSNSNSSNSNSDSNSSGGMSQLMKDGAKTLAKVLGSIISLPVRNLDEIIPPQLCSRFMENDFVCSQTMLQYLFTGSKKDYKKMLLPEDKKNCITYDEKGNRIVQCKISGGSGNSELKKYKGGTATEMIIECNKKTSETQSQSDDTNSGKLTNPKGSKSPTDPDPDDKLNKHMERKLKLLLDKLIKVNLYLRKYQCPKDKLISLIEKIKDKKLLEKMLELCNKLLGDYNFNLSLSDQNRTKQCDEEFKYNKTERGEEYTDDLKVVPEIKYMRLWYKEGETDCKTCSMPWADLLGKYACLLSSSLIGSKNEINYILLNIVQDMDVIEKGTGKAIYTNITHIIKNIECRSNLRKVLQNQIDKL